MDFGPGGSNLGLLAARRGFDVTAVDLEQTCWPYMHSRLRFVQGDILKMSFPPQYFDLVINCSTVEHVGLSGRYGVKFPNPDGDLKAMSLIRSWLKPGGLMLLTIPVGRDSVFIPMHRVYGVERLPRLLNGYSVEKKEFWLKDREMGWVIAKEEDALAGVAAIDFYGLGCFLLRPKQGKA